MKTIASFSWCVHGPFNNNNLRLILLLLNAMCWLDAMQRKIISARQLLSNEFVRNVIRVPIKLQIHRKLRADTLSHFWFLFLFLFVPHCHAELPLYLFVSWIFVCSSNFAWVWYINTICIAHQISPVSAILIASHAHTRTTTSQFT